MLHAVAFFVDQKFTHSLSSLCSLWTTFELVELSFSCYFFLVSGDQLYIFCIWTSPKKTWCGGFWLSLITNHPYQFLLADRNSRYPSCGMACKTIKPAELAGLNHGAHLIFLKKDASHQLESNTLSCSHIPVLAVSYVAHLQPRMWISDGKPPTFKTQTMLCSRKYNSAWSVPGVRGVWCL